jgi:DNA-directed RNA polymerase specialized sigma24 family protein
MARQGRVAGSASRSSPARPGAGEASPGSDEAENFDRDVFTAKAGLTGQTRRCCDADDLVQLVMLKALVFDDVKVSS